MAVSLILLHNFIIKYFTNIILLITKYLHIDGPLQVCGISIASAMEIPQSYAKPSICITSATKSFGYTEWTVPDISRHI